MYFPVMIVGFLFQFFNKRIFLVLFAFILLLISSFRFGIGVDYFAYEFLYDNLYPTVLDEIKFGTGEQEIGFRAMGAFLKGLGFTYQGYLIVFATLNTYFIYKICSKYSLNPTLSLLFYFTFYFFAWQMSGIRQSIVIAIGLYYLLKYIDEKKGYKLIIISVILSFIHLSALILIVYYFLSKFNFKKSTLIIMTIASIIVSVFPVGNLISNATFLPFYEKIYPYLGNGFSFNILDFQSISRLVFLILIFLVYNQYSKQGQMQTNIINIYILGMIIYFTLQFSELLAARIAIYGKFMDIIIFSNILYLYKKPLNKLLYIYLVFALCTIYLYKEVNAQINNSVEDDKLLHPYPTVFNQHEYEFKSRYKNLID